MSKKSSKLIKDTNTHHNNFDLLRLLAASQVAFLHVANNLEIRLDGFLLLFKGFLQYFPGVPIFFVISGFLISSSLERNPNLWDYMVNRVLRIYPALWVSTLITIFLLITFGDKVWEAFQLNNQSTIFVVTKWLFAQLTLGQFYNPHIMKDNYGVGHLNGSLWTIPVELQFYIFLPFLASLVWRGFPRVTQNLRLIVAILLLYSVTYFYLTCRNSLQIFSENLSLLDHVSLLPYLYMFMLGIILQFNQESLSKFLNGKAIIWLVTYIVVAFILNEKYGIKLGTNTPNLLLMTLLSVAVVSIAFTCPDLSKKILKNNDVSYGVYIYHMVVANLTFELGYSRTLSTFYFVLVITYLMAILSWLLIERPALKLKRNPLLCRR